MKNFFRIFLIPLAIALIVLLSEFGLKTLSAAKVELSYSVQPPVAIIDPKRFKNLEININGSQANFLYSNQIDLENTGGAPLKDLMVKITFEASDSLFKIYNYEIVTFPEFEENDFTKSLVSNSIRLNFKLLNPGELVYVYALTNQSIGPRVSSRYENMKLVEARSNDIVAGQLKGIPNGSPSIFTFIVSLFSVIAAAAVMWRYPRVTKSWVSLVDKLIREKPSQELKIISAIYGKGTSVIDVTNKLNNMIKNNSLYIVANNDLGGDPVPGVEKELKIIYSYGEKVNAIRVLEHEPVRIPPGV